MQKHIAMSAVLVAALVGCKKKAGMSIDDAIAAMGGFRDEMCACKDRACADGVQGRFTTWAQEEASRAPASRLSEAQTRRMTEISQAYGQCMAPLMSDPLATPPVGPAQATMADANVTNADVLIKQVYDRLGKDHVVTRLELSYIRADGTIDPTYGRAEVDLGKPKRPTPADDPDRPIGAPVPVDDHLVDDVMARCPQYRWEGGKRTDGETTCGMGMLEPLARPKCTVLAVWKQAIAAGAPAAGLALIELRGDGWELTIDDGPRNIHFQQTFPDTCEPMLERP